MRALPRISVQNPVLGNLLTLAVLAGGLYAAFTLVREMFPEFRPNQVAITTPYPGASPAEIEKGISIKIEEQIKDIQGIDKINTRISEGLSFIMVTLEDGFDNVDRVVDDIKNAIDAIPRNDFPDEAEETIVRRFEPLLPVINVSWFGAMSDAQLKEMGKRLRDDILALPGITEVQLSGTRRDEISVEIEPDQLVRYGLSFLDVAETIRRTSLDLPGGQVKTSAANVAVRTLGEKDRGEEFEDLVVRTSADGSMVRLRDVARVVDAFEDVDVRSRLDGQPGVSVLISKTGEQDAILIAERVKALVAGKNRQAFSTDWLGRLTGRDAELRAIYERAYADPYPEIGQLKTHSDLSRFVKGRLELLVRNAMWGLLFVFLSLLAFMNLRVAFWVTIGLVFAVLGTLLAMKLTGISLNLISMFGLIVVLGMLVDDAIVVAENVYTRMEQGEQPEKAAIEGAEEVSAPVVSAVSTTIVAFFPLYFIAGRIGEFMGVLPVIVMLALGISLFEALAILPSHLAHSFRRQQLYRAARAHRAPGPYRRFRARLHQLQVAVVEGLFRRGYRALLARAVAYRYVTIAAGVALLVLGVGAVGGGIIELVFLQKIDAETLVAELTMPVGTPMERTDEKLRVVERAATSIPEVQTVLALVGGQVDISGTAGDTSDAHRAQLIMELYPGETRRRTSTEVLNELREKSAGITGINALTFTAITGGPGGSPIQIEISGERVPDLLAVAAQVKDRLREYTGVFDIEDDFDAGQREIQIELLDSGRALGLTTESVAMQVRAAFYGLEARKVQRDREDVKVMVRYPRLFRERVADLEQMRVAAPGGWLVPLGEVARVREGSSFATIKRLNQQRTVTVYADVDETLTNATEIRAELEPRLQQLMKEYPGTRFRQGGESEESAKAFGSLHRDALIAAALIYVVLAAQFHSYIQPAIVMMAIPFGLVGALAGHLLMGYPLTVLSVIGLVALSGIVVNDSLILVDFANRRRAEGAPVEVAVVDAGQARLRAIMLTSITTILGIGPMVLETSFQAKFLIPMAISIAFGLAFATVLTLLIVPCLYVMIDDVTRALRATQRFLWPDPVVESSSPASR